MKSVQILLISVVFHIATCETVTIYKEDSISTDSVRMEVGEPRKRKEDLMSKILPIMVMPFMTSVTMLPMMLVGMKISLIVSTVLGKLAIILTAINLLRKFSNPSGGTYSHNIHVKHNDYPPPPPITNGDEHFEEYEENNHQASETNYQHAPDIPVFSYVDHVQNNYNDNNYKNSDYSTNINAHNANNYHTNSYNNQNFEGEYETNQIKRRRSSA